MEELYDITVSDERLEDCRDVVEPDLQDLIRATIASGFSAEEVLIAISELVAEDFAAVVNQPADVSGNRLRFFPSIPTFQRRC